MTKTPDSRPLLSWRIFHTLGRPNTYMGIVQAVDEKSAIQKAIEEFDITDREQQKRLVAEQREAL